MQTDLGEPKSSSRPQAEFLFHLYILEGERRHQKIRETLKQLFDEHLPGVYHLRIINVSKHPEKATEANVLATPTLVKLQPKPAQRIVGDLFAGDDLFRELRIFPTETY